MKVCVFIRFTGQTSNGSLQPKMWFNLFRHPTYEVCSLNEKIDKAPSLHDRTLHCWLSEYPNSLNLEILTVDEQDLDQVLHHIRTAIAGVVEANIFRPTAATPDKGDILDWKQPTLPVLPETEIKKQVLRFPVTRPA